METSREEFLKQIRSRLTPTTSEAQPYRVEAPNANQSPSELARQFTAALEKTGGQVYCVSGYDQARQALTTILAASGVPRVIWLDTSVVRPLLEGQDGSVEFVQAPVDGTSMRQVIQAPDAALTGADYAIAETGTLVLFSRPDQPRLLSALVAVHIAVIHASQLVPTLASLLPEIRQTLPRVSNITLITGPSRTGDIEQTLTIGAHGPRELHVILLPGVLEAGET